MPDLAMLLQTHKEATGDSYRAMARRTDGVIHNASLANMAAGRLREWPTPRTLEALARLLHTDITTVVLATARSLGLQVRYAAPALAASLPPDTEVLNWAQRDAVVRVVRELVSAQRGADEMRVAFVRLAEELDKAVKSNEPPEQVQRRVAGFISHPDLDRTLADNADDDNDSDVAAGLVTDPDQS